MKNMKLSVAFLMMLFSFQSISQISINAGTGVLKGFTVPKVLERWAML